MEQGEARRGAGNQHRGHLPARCGYGVARPQRDKPGTEMEDVHRANHAP